MPPKTIAQNTIDVGRAAELSSFSDPNIANKENRTPIMPTTRITFIDFLRIAQAYSSIIFSFPSIFNLEDNFNRKISFYIILQSKYL